MTVEAQYAEAVLNGKNVTASPPKTEIWALLYAQVRQADGKDTRNILLDDRKLRVIPRVPARVTTAFGELMFPFQNIDAAVHGEIQWTQLEIVALLQQLGLPADSPISALCVEMMQTQRVQTAAAGTTGAFVAAQASDVRPLSDDLGHHRVLRTSPLTPAPPVCCPDCP